MPDGPAILALPADLVFASRIRATAQALGIDVRVLSRPAALLEAARNSPPRLILVDLDARGWDPAGIVREIKDDARTADTRVVGFVSHVHEAAIQAARDAGADRVLARSAFVRELPELLKRATQ
jgi:DNA-binding NarL/FixJ family response regulator